MSIVKFWKHTWRQKTKMLDIFNDPNLTQRQTLFWIWWLANTSRIVGRNYNRKYHTHINRYFLLPLFHCHRTSCHDVFVANEMNTNTVCKHNHHRVLWLKVLNLCRLLGWVFEVIKCQKYNRTNSNVVVTHLSFMSVCVPTQL